MDLIRQTEIPVVWFIKPTLIVHYNGSQVESQAQHRKLERN